MPLFLNLLMLKQEACILASVVGIIIDVDVSWN